MNRPPNYEQPPDSLLEESESDLVLHAKIVDGVVVEEWITQAEAKRRHAVALAAAASQTAA